MARIQGTDDLFRLVHSLNKTERGYFRKFATRHVTDSNKYLKLFDAVAAQEKFEEASLKRNFKAYPVIKNYLFNMILRSLLQYEENFEKREELMLQIVHSETLNRKGLADKALQLLEKGLEEARKHQVFMLEEEFIRRIFFAKWQLWTPAEYRKNPMNIFEELEKASDKQRNEDRYRKEGFKIFIHEQKNSLNIRTQRKNEEVEVRFLESEQSAITPKGKQLRLINLIHYYNMVNDNKKAYAVSREFFLSEKKNYSKNREQPYSRYGVAIKFHILSCINNLRLKEAMNLLDKDWHFPYTGEAAKMEDLFHFLHFKVNIYWQMGEHRQGEELVHQYWSELNDPANTKNFLGILAEVLKMNLLFQLSNAEYQKAALSIHSFQNGLMKKGHSEYFKGCELLKVMLQAELGNYLVMQSTIRNLLRREKQLSLSGYEVQFLKELKKLNAINVNQVFGRLCDLFPQESDKVKILGVFSINAWLQSRLHKVPLAEVIKTYWAVEAKKYQ